MWCVSWRKTRRKKKKGGEEDEEDEVTVDFEGGKFLKTRPNDVIGVAFCQSDMPMLSFYHNGTPISMYDVDKVRGTVRPAISVEQGASAEFIFDEESFKHSPPNSTVRQLVPRLPCCNTQQFYSLSHTPSLIFVFIRQHEF